MNQKKNINNILGKLSLLHFAILGLTIFFIVSPWLIIFAVISSFRPFSKLMDIYYLIMLYMVKFYIWVSPIKFNLKDLNIIARLDQNDYVLVCNHRSHLDMFIFLANVYKLRSVANSYIFKVPLLGQVMSMSKHFKMEKGNVHLYQKTLNEIAQSLKTKHKVLFFPEMTRCPPGYEGIQKFRMIPFQIAKNTNTLIVPVVISGTDDLWPRGLMQLDFSKKISIKALAPVRPSEFENTAQLAKHIHEIMEMNLRELRS